MSEAVTARSRRPRRRNSAPTSGDSGAGIYVVAMHDDVLTYTVARQENAAGPRRLQAVVPTAAQVARVPRRLLDELRIWQWKSDYPTQGCPDGTSGRSKSRIPTSRSATQGSNNFPDASGEPTGQPVPTEGVSTLPRRGEKLARRARIRVSPRLIGRARLGRSEASAVAIDSDNELQTACGMGRISAAKAILIGGSIAGACDILYAIIYSWLARGTPPVKILQSVASGLLGKAAFEGGWLTAELGLFLHFFIAISAAVIFYFAAHRMSDSGSSRRPSLACFTDS